MATQAIPQHHLLVDGDIIAYQSAAASDGRVYSIISDDPQIEFPDTFKYKKEAEEFVASANSSFGTLSIKQDFIPEEESHALHNVKESIRKITEKFPGNILEVFITGNTNFRNDFVSNYKANRTNSRTPHHLNTCKQYLLNRYSAKLEEGFEADDLIGCRATELTNNNTPYIICSLDKDLKMIPGLHYDWRKDEQTLVTSLDAIENFYKQVLTGDTTDNIQGLSGIGPVKAKAILAGCRFEKELYLNTLNAYMEHYAYCHTIPEIERKLWTAASLLWILREPSTLWSPPL